MYNGPDSNMSAHTRFAIAFVLHETQWEAGRHSMGVRSGGLAALPALWVGAVFSLSLRAPLVASAVIQRDTLHGWCSGCMCSALAGWWAGCRLRLC